MNKLIDKFNEIMLDVYADRDNYSRGKIIELAKEAFAEVVNENDLSHSVSGCWLASNSIRPTQDGIYRTIDSHGNEGLTIMDTGHWIIMTGGHPINLWFKAN